MSKLYWIAGFLLVGWFLILQLEKKGKLNAERHLVFLLLRTQRGKDFIASLSKFKFWPYIATFGIAVALFGMVLVVFSLGYAIYSTYILKTRIEGATLVIPGVTIPFWHGIIGLITVLVIHEFSHGIIAKSEDVPIKNLGAVFFTIIPIGAFVEPDEDTLKAKSRISKLRVYSAGSFGNIVLALLALTAWILFSAQVFDPHSLQIVNVAPGSPADGVLERGMLILEIEGQDIRSPEDFITATREIEAGQDVSIRTDRGSYIIKAASREKHPTRGYIGIQVHSAVKRGVSKYVGLGVLLFISGTLQWIFYLNQGIGLINLAPLHFGVAATDGHHILKEIISQFIGEATAEKITLFISTSTLFALIFTLISPGPGMV
jgi:membrane-associated protease RseP (regulator of RpoE activity)